MKRQMITKELMDILVCPVCKGDLILQSNSKESYHFLYCSQCNQEYPIDDGIPNMLPLEMRIPSDEHGNNVSLSIKRANVRYYVNRERERDKWVTHPSKILGLPRLLDFTLKYLNRPNMKVLDVGSGVGLLSSHLCDRGLKPVCFDISHDCIAAAVKCDPHLNSFVADAENMPVRENSFEGVLFAGSLHHLPNPRKALSEAFRVLRDGGRVILLEPNSRSTGIAVEVIRVTLRVMLCPRLVTKDFVRVYNRALAKVLKRNVIKYGGKQYARDANGRWVTSGETERDISLPYVLRLAKMTTFKVLDVRTQEIASAFARFLKKDMSLETGRKLQKIDQMLLERIPLLNKYGDCLLLALQK